jgi:hypothetical protein
MFIITLQRIKEGVMGGICGMHGKTNTYRILIGNLKGRDHMEFFRADRKIMLKWI